MADKIQAVATYRPRILHARTAGLPELAARMARGSLLTEAIARMALEELAEALGVALREGEQVVLPGIGRFGSAIKLDGRIRTRVTLDSALRDAVGRPEAFGGTIQNREAIGESLDGILARWNAEHPEDPVPSQPASR